MHTFIQTTLYVGHPRSDPPSLNIVSSDQDAKHFLVFSYPAFGHVTPLLELSRRIVAAGHRVTFAVSESLMDDMYKRNVVVPADEKRIRLFLLKDGIQSSHDECLSADDLVLVSNRLSVAIRDLISSLPVKSTRNGYSRRIADIPSVDVIISDVFICDAPFTAAVEQNIPIFGFSPMAGFMAMQYLGVTEQTALGNEDVKGEMKTDQLPAGLKDKYLKIRKSLAKATGLMFNSFTGLEPNIRGEVLKLCPEFTKLKIGCVGPVVAHSPDDPMKHSETSQVSRWLDKQKERSVVYVSFGSMLAPKENQLLILCETLRAMNRPFIWALKSAYQAPLSQGVKEAIKSQFQTTGCPFLILAWAPQTTILKHKATRLFVSHCGWNSTLEGISFGVPILAWPMCADQHGNAEMVERLGCGKKIKNVDMAAKRIVSQEELTGLIDEVAQWDSSLSENTYFTKAQKLSEDGAEVTSKDGDSQKNLELILQGD
ncbi:hypothetical protein RvY_04707 [Ramazzottius varieornatus]|uniref:UDP-glucuronosyltransferase n=1 Tax=Ramazzottius varieornatus TaxID=947166 RepID=A0A1D1V2G8_RAMVA|nr:hypothetical protein RvY_04707 [Ramazzottius varieornatus]